MNKITKKILSVFAASAIAVSMLPAAFAANDDIKVIVNGSELQIAENDTKPFVEDGRTLVPMRAIFEALGATVEWDDATKTVTSKSDNGNIEMTVGSDTIKINGADTMVDVPAKIVEGRTVVPVRVISEGLNCKVEWSQETQTVTITSADSLSLWTNDATAKAALTNYMNEITDENSDKFIPVESRVAVFDLDGTLFCETDPNYFDYCLLKYRVLDDPEYKDKASDFEKEVANKIKEQNETGASFKGLEVDHGKAVASAFKGMTNAEFNDYIQEFKKQSMPSYEGMTRGEGFYKPMIEVVNYLKANDFDVYVVSGTDRFIVRGIVDNSPLDLPNRKIIGSDETLVATGQGDTDGLDYVFTDQDKLVLGGDFIIKNLKMNKVTVIMQEIGQQPVLSFGNSTGDASMAEFVTTNNPYESLAFMLCCDDTERENGNTEKADKMFNLCEEFDWVPVSMKNDWKTIYGDGVTYLSAENTGDKLAEIKERGVLKVGAAGDYQPMSYLDPDTEQYVGFDAELAEDLAKEIGVDVEYVKTSWPTLMDDTLNDSFDLAICGITVTDARKEQALMSDGYLGNGKTILIRAEDVDKYKTLEDINRPEVRVMENPGGLNEKFVRENLPNATLMVYDKNEEIPSLIASGEADVMITEIMEAGYYVGQDSRLAAPLIYEPFTNGQLGVLMPKGSEDLLEFVNEFLAKEKESGRIDELGEKYIYKFIK